ncbi:MAG: hypothetical protein C0505_06350 [Leptothrix sp. (in: Bacteria)]|nr:hypothetical protein [Leptothrix sp. (in: b-proteobacteria)]
MRAIAALALALALAACGGDDDDPPPPVEGSATLDAAGGTVDGPDGVQLLVPAGTMAAPVTFRVSRDGTGAPELLGLNAVSPIYAVTPHGQAFDGSARLSIPLSAAPLLPAGAKPLLLKAEPGGKWRIMQNVSDDPARLAVDLDGLSYYVIGSCTSLNPTWTIGAVDCPGVDHRLELNLSAGEDGPPILVGTGVNTPAWTVTDTPQTLFMGAFYRRPEGTNRTDQLALVGLPGGFNSTGFRSTWTNQVYDIPPSFGSYGQRFRVTIDPAQVSSANTPNGRMLRVRAYASYTATGFRVGPGGGPVAVGFEFQVDFPIRVRYSGPQPTISQQPANLGVTEGQPASFTVQAAITPAAALTYQWSRRANANATFAPIAGATAASYSLTTTALSDDGAQFQVVVCAAATRCITSSPATLSVTQVTVVPVFTQDPADLSAAAGQTASFSVTATGLPLPQLKWQSALSTGGFADVAGVAACGVTNPPASGISVSATCTLGPLAVAQSGQRLRAVATNAAAPGGIFSSAATLTVNAAPQAPVITQQPAAQTTTVGGSASFSVAATGTAPLAYTWQQSGTNLPSVNGGFNAGTCSGTVTYSNGNTTITLSGLSAGCNGVAVGVTVSNGVNPSAVSNGVILMVNPAVTSGACVAGQSGWCYANPLPQAGGLNGLAYDASTSTFTAVGPLGTTLRTADGGATWQAQFEAGRTYFSDVASPAPGLLVAAGVPPFGSGQNTGVFTSTDGGRTWTRRLDAGFPGLGPVMKLAFANSSVGVVAGPPGVWRTTDGGLNWVAVANVSGADTGVSGLAGGVAWVDANVGLIYGGGGKILRSADAGVTWTDVSPAGLVDDWIDMAFNAAGVGVAVGPNGKVARSINGGQVWQEVVTPMSEPGTAVAFADGNTVVALGNLGQTMRSTDAGATWTAGYSYGASSWYRLRFASPTFGLAVSAIGGLTLRTSDGGQTWTRIGGGTIDENVTGMAASPSGSVVLAGSLGRDLLRSVDGGATWALPGFSLVGARFQKPSFATEQRVIAIRPSGQVALSVDAGQTWSIAYDRLGQVGLSNTTMASATLGFVVGDNGLVLRTSDGGSSWAPVTSGTTQPLRSVGCLTAAVCLVGGFDGALLRSVDGGATWSAARLPGTAGGSSIRTIARVNDNTVVLAVDDGLWRSADAGLTWTRVYTPTSGSQLGVSFNGAGTGIAVGYDGILRSTDQGLTWAAQAVPAPSYLNAVTWVSASALLVGGDGGAILRNLQAGAP